MLTFLATFIELSVIFNALLVAFLLGRLYEYSKLQSFKDSLLSLLNKTNNTNETE